MKNILTVIVLTLFIASINVAQNDLPRLSPKATVSQEIGYTNVTVTYSRPGVKDREIWGGLVPLNQCWRTGANEATIIEFENDLSVEGNEVPRGKYALFTIPGEDEWIIILNKVWDQWGAFNYDESEDLLRFKVEPEESDFTERFLITFEYVSPYSADIVLEWGEIEVSFNLETR